MKEDSIKLTIHSDSSHSLFIRAKRLDFFWWVLLIGRHHQADYTVTSKDGIQVYLIWSDVVC